MRVRSITRLGFTLIELLVVLVILAILIALLIPAVQYARDRARQTQCRAQLKQLALAALLHEQYHGHFPTGGWGWEYAGDPDAGFGRNQPGGWFYNILPYLEQDRLHSLGMGLDKQAKLAAQVERIETIVPGAICPSRRSNQLIVHQGPPYNGQIVNAGEYAYTSKIDYAINSGTVPDLECEEVRDQNDETSEINKPVGLDKACDTSKFDGVSFFYSEIRGGQIVDGFSHTYLIGEKYLDADQYDSGIDAGDNESPFTGVNADHYRSTSSEFQLMRDEPGYLNKFAFGSAHPTGFHVAFCDGSVHRISYAIEPMVHEACGSRDGGEGLQW